MPVSKELARQIHREFCQAARPQQYITEACEKYGLTRAEVRKAIGLRTRDPEEEEGRRPEDWPPYEEAEGQERAEQSPAPTVRQPKKSGNPNGRPRTVDGAAERTLVEDLKNGMPTSEAAVKYGCCRDTVRRIRNRHAEELAACGNVRRRGCVRAFTLDTEVQMINDMLDGMTVMEVTQKYACSEATVWRIRKRHGFCELKKEYESRRKL